MDIGCLWLQLSSQEDPLATSQRQGGFVKTPELRGEAKAPLWNIETGKDHI